MIDVESGYGWLVVVLVALLIGGASGIGTAGSTGTAIDDADPGRAPTVSSPKSSGAPSPETPVTGTRTRDGVGIDAINVTGRAVAGTENGTTFLWPTDPFAVTVSIDPGGTAAESSLCLSIERNETVELARCRPIASGAVDASRERPLATFAFDRWPTNASGPHRVRVVLDGSNGSAGGVSERTTRPVYVVRRSGDVDGDGLSNEDEVALGTNLTDTDTDRDGLLDGAEVAEYGSDSRSADTDDDRLRDGVEVQRGTHPNRTDTDGDGVPDGEEVAERLDPKRSDTDSDGVDDGIEVANGTNPRVQDTDRDGIIDGRERTLGTDPLRADTDGDLLGDAVEWRFGTDPTDPWAPLVPIAVVPLALLVGIVVWYRRSAIGVIDSALVGLDGFSRDRSDSGTVVASTGSPDEAADPPSGTTPLTDEERVLELLRGEGGRAKQIRIVELTDWSKAKVSRVLSRMEEGGMITRIKIGRENLVCLEGHVPQAVRSPFED